VLDMNQVLALSSDAVHVMSSAQLNAMFLATPIMLDLSGHGIQTLSASQGVSFDLTGTGHAQQYGWVGSGAGLLALDLNGNGKIDSGAELFGTGTLLPDGSHAANGFQALAAQDTNHDGKITALDANFSKLVVWVDANHDGKVEAGELKTLTQLGITELDLAPQAGHGVNNGNVIGLISSYKTADGQTHEMADVWLAKNQTGPTQTAPVTTVHGLSTHEVLASPHVAVLGGDASHSSIGLNAPHAHLMARKPGDPEESTVPPLL